MARRARIGIEDEPADPAISFDGETCEYRGPAVIESGLTKFAFTNSSGEQGVFVIAFVNPAEGPDEAGARIADWWANHLPVEDSGVVYETNMPSAAEGDKTLTLVLGEGSMTVVCLSNLTNPIPDAYEAAALFDVG